MHTNGTLPALADLGTIIKFVFQINDQKNLFRSRVYNFFQRFLFLVLMLSGNKDFNYVQMVSLDFTPLISFSLSPL